MANFVEIIGLLRGLTDGQVAKVGPFYVTVDITRQCNLHCPGCRYHSPDVHVRPIGDESVRQMPLPLFQQLCDDLKSMGTADYDDQR